MKPEYRTKEKNAVNQTDCKRYFILRKYHCGTYNSITGEIDTDIIGLTTDEEYAKSRVSVFCNYEEVKMIPWAII